MWELNKKTYLVCELGPNEPIVDLWATVFEWTFDSAPLNQTSILPLCLSCHNSCNWRLDFVGLVALSESLADFDIGSSSLPDRLFDLSVFSGSLCQLHVSTGLSLLHFSMGHLRQRFLTRLPHSHSHTQLGFV